MNPQKLYISRAYVEFGPFTPDELRDFHARGILQEIDHIRAHGADDWLDLNQWLALGAPVKKLPAKKAARKVAPQATAKVAKKAPAKKTAKKAAKKASPRRGPTV